MKYALITEEQIKTIRAALVELQYSNSTLVSDLKYENALAIVKSLKTETRFRSILDQALKDQKDAERYMHLKHILIDSTISKKFEGSTPKDIDDLIDELVRSYDE